MELFKWEEKNGCIAKLEQTGTLDSLYNYIGSAMPKFLKHCFINRKQTESYQLDIEEAQSFDSNIMTLQMDFAENYAYTAQDEVQSAHWKQAQITLCTSVAWFRSDIFSHGIISDNLKHDKYVVVVYLSEILKYKPINVHFLKVWTDGPSSQFKNKYVMGAKEMLSEMYSIKIIWNFSATSHGKGLVDGVGATLKQIAADKVHRWESIIKNLQDFYNAVMHSRVKVIVCQ